MHLVALLTSLMFAALAPARGDLFDNTVKLLSDRFYDDQFRLEVLPGLIEKYQASAAKASSLQAERMIVHELLSEIPASHLALLSRHEYRVMFRELSNKPQPTFGFELIEVDGAYFVKSVLEGGPADRSGLLGGDRLLTIDGIEVGVSPRLDWRSDDAALPDPPVHRLLGAIGDGITLQIERRPDQRLDLDLVASNYAAIEATKAGARVIRHEGRKIAYFHLWFIHMQGIDKLLAKHMRLKFADASALVIDLRGRGGSADMAIRLLRLLRDYEKETGKPVIALIDSMTRSAKEVIAHGLRKYQIATLVGERTAGAVLPASFERVGEETVLMFPTMTLSKYTELLEGIGVEPDVFADSPGMYSAGEDPILSEALDEAVRQIESRRLNQTMVPPSF